MQKHDKFEEASSAVGCIGIAERVKPGAALLPALLPCWHERALKDPRDPRGITPQEQVLTLAAAARTTCAEKALTHKQQCRRKPLLL